MREDGLVRLRLDLAYDGTAFRGWAAQPGLRTVQGELESALATVLRSGPLPVTCAGRTDAGVHARGQVVHVDVDRSLLDAVVGRSTGAPVEVLARRLDGILPDDVVVRSAVVAAPGFDARFSALSRRYAYRLADSPGARDPLTRTHVVPWPRRLDLGAMNLATSDLLGLRDFAAFCRRREGATTVRTLLELAWSRDDAGRAVGTVRADAFCHSMVRALVGCLVAVGEGRRGPGWPAEVLAARVRDPAVTVMPAAGLTLEEVAYPADADLAGQAEAARTVRVLPGEGG